MILIAGPYRSGTNDNPQLMAENVRIMEAFALPVFRAGHIPVIGEWFALPLVHLAGTNMAVYRPAWARDERVALNEMLATTQAWQQDGAWESHVPPRV